LKNTRTDAGIWLKDSLPEGTNIGVTEVPWQFQMPPIDQDKYKIKVTGYDVEMLKKQMPDYFLISSFQTPIPPYPVNLQQERVQFWTEMGKTNLYQPVKVWRYYPSFLNITFKYKTMPEDLIYLNPTVVLLKKRR
jgi:hypothetical protein